MNTTEMALDERVREQERRLEKLELQVGLLSAQTRVILKNLALLSEAILVSSS